MNYFSILCNRGRLVPGQELCITGLYFILAKYVTSCSMCSATLLYSCECMLSPYNIAQRVSMVILGRGSYADIIVLSVLAAAVASQRGRDLSGRLVECKRS